MGTDWRAALFARDLTEVFTPHDTTLDPDLEHTLAHINTPREMLSPFTMMEMNHVIKRLHPHKAPGLDNITAKMIQELPIPGLKILLYILNAVLRLEYWPTSLKLAKVIMILKPTKPPTEVTSYRPISLLPIISKTLEKLLLLKLTNGQHYQDWLSEHQFGFRKAHSTTQQCHRLADNINRALE